MNTAGRITSRRACNVWLLCALLLTAAPWVGCSVAPEVLREKLLFVARPHKEDSREDFRIFLMNPDGSQQKALTSSQAFEVDPVWSPDGKQVAFAKVDFESDSAYIYVMNADGSGRKQLTRQGANTLAAAPCWSPDGKRIVFYVCEPESKEKERSIRDAKLFVMDADVQNRKRLGDGPGILPMWSPDGKKVLYTVREFEAENRGINVMDADGTNAKVLLKGNAWGGVWSPDGKRIACVGRAEKHNTIFLMNADGSERKPVGESPGGFITAVQWSVDGMRLYFNIFQVPNGPFAIFVMDVSGTNLKRLTDDKTSALLGGSVSLFND